MKHMSWKKRTPIHPDPGETSLGFRRPSKNFKKNFPKTRCDLLEPPKASLILRTLSRGDWSTAKVAFRGGGMRGAQPPQRKATWGDVIPVTLPRLHYCLTTSAF